MSLRLKLKERRFPLAQAFRISRGARTHADVVAVTLGNADHTGRGECVPYARYGESIEGVVAMIMQTAPDFAIGMDREELQERLPPGAARNALDCAAWDFAAKQAGKPVWELAGLAPPEPLTTAYTLSLDAPEKMRAAAEAAAERPLLKIKLAGGEEDLARVEAVRAGAPGARLIVDANEGWGLDQLRDMPPKLADLGVALIEQPIPAGDDAALDGIARPVPLCADESCHDRASLEALKGRYDYVNIKLDKTGGLTEALALRREAEAAGFGIMVGCMVGSSLSMAPAALVAQGAGFVDLDGPLLLAEDREDAIMYEGSTMHPPKPALWG